jgi:hypothetical protein
MGDAGAGVAAGGCGTAAAGGGCEVLSFCAGAEAFEAASSASDDADKRILRLMREEWGPIMTKFLTGVTASRRTTRAISGRSFGPQQRRHASARHADEGSKQRCQEMGGPRD